MKGPGMRIDLDVRRVWQCPACGRQTRTEGNVVVKRCGCTREGVPMRLIELPRPKPTVRVVQPDEPEIHEFSDFPTDIPVNPKHPAVGDPSLDVVRLNDVHVRPTDGSFSETDEGPQADRSEDVSGESSSVPGETPGEPPM